MCAAKGSGDIVNRTHELLSDTLAVRRAIDVKAVQLDRSRCADTGWRIFALHLGEGYQYLALVREQRDHVWVEQFLSLLKVAESVVQVRTQIVGSIVRAEGLFKGARSKGGQCRGVALKARTNQNGFLAEHVRCRQSVLHETGTLVVDPLLYAGSTPLQVGVVDQQLWYRIAMRDQPLQHHGKIHISDRPLPE
jgi:hypothetical protein